jgi:hypothetical protein
MSGGLEKLFPRRWRKTAPAPVPAVDPQKLTDAEFKRFAGFARKLPDPPELTEEQAVELARAARSRAYWR